MWVTQVEWCDFFVWSPRGHFLERLALDHSYVEMLVDSASLFFQECITPRLEKGRSHMYFKCWFPSNFNIPLLFSRATMSLPTFFPNFNILH